jgi:hypothetical protein
VTVRKVLSIVLGVAATFSVGLGLIVFSSARNIDETIAHSRQIDVAFREAVNFVRTWRRSEGRLPNSDEFAAWASKLPEEPNSAKDMQYSLNDFPQEVIAKFGRPSGEAYLLTYWRGEWDEYYASWTDTSSLIFDTSKYFMLGSRWLDLFAFCFVGFALVGAAFVAWPPNNAMQRSALVVTPPAGKGGGEDGLRSASGAPTARRR